MTEAEVTRIAEMIKRREDAKDWLSTFEHADEKRTHIIFADVCGSQGDFSERGGWTDELIVPRDIAIEMLRWLIARYQLEINDAGIKP